MINICRIAYKPVVIVSLLGIIAFPIIFLACRFSKKQLTIDVFNNALKIDNVLDSIKLIAEEGSTITQTLKKQLDDEFNQLFKALQNEFPLTPQAWENRLNLLENLKQKDTLITKNPIVRYHPKDIPIVKKTRELLAFYNINPQAVMVEPINDPEIPSSAFAGQYCKNNKIIHFMKLNLVELFKHTPIVQEAIIKHEIMHLLNYDSLICTFIDGLFKDHGITPEESWANDTFSTFNKFIELRADLMASTDIVTAQAMQESFAEFMKKYDDDAPCRTHPSCKSRCAALNNLIQYMHAENQLKLA